MFGLISNHGLVFCASSPGLAIQCHTIITGLLKALELANQFPASSATATHFDVSLATTCVTACVPRSWPVERAQKMQSPRHCPNNMKNDNTNNNNLPREVG